MASSDLTTALLAALPILLILVMMLGLRWSAARAGIVALGACVILAYAAFGFEGPYGLAGVLLEAGFTTATILWILWPALALHYHQQRCGALDALRSGLGRLSPDPALQALLIAWFLALFFEGAAGFGTPVALAAPLLAGLGVPPVKAVVLALLGHAAGVSFGALGTPVLTQAVLTGIDAREIAWRTALLNTAAGAVLVALFLRALTSSFTAAPARASVWAWGAVAAVAFLGPSLLLAAVMGPELATLGAALAGGSLFAALLRRFSARDTTAAPPTQGGELGRALWPYLLLTALVIPTRAVPAVSEVLESLSLEWRWQDKYGARVQLLGHPGTLLFAALLGGAALQRVPLAALRSPFGDAARRLLPVALALMAMLCLSRLMLHAGMIQALQHAAVDGFGAWWPWISPWVGALGSFITGSATASNVLFTSLQAETASALGLPVAVLVAAQCFGAAVGNVICPHNVIAGAATVGLAGQEGSILRQTVWPCVAYLLAGGAALSLLLASGLAN